MAREEARADALNRVRAGLAARNDRRGGGLDREDLELLPRRLEHLRAAGDVAAGADPGDQRVEQRVAEVGENFLGRCADVDVVIRLILELLGHPRAGGRFDVLDRTLDSGLQSIFARGWFEGVRESNSL